jgi:transcription initiation factor TFIID TATA-box-binding protein
MEPPFESKSGNPITLIFISFDLKTYIKDVIYTAKKPAKAGGNNIPIPVIKIQNIVVSADLHAVIDLYSLSKEVKAVDYEPEQFPGAIFKIAEPKAVIILFKNGKMICTGTNTEANIKRVLDYASKVISKYVIEVTPVTKAPAKA